jgi:hypothetical protein
MNVSNQTRYCAPVPILMALVLLLPAAAVFAQPSEELVKPVKLMQIKADDAGVQRTFFGRVSKPQPS